MDKIFPVRERIYNFSGYKVIYKVIIGLLFLILLSCSSLHSLAQISTVADGAWDTGSTWTVGSVPSKNHDALVNNSVIIHSGTTVEINNLSIGSEGKLTVEGTLIVYGNLTMVNNDPELNTGSESSIFIFGNAVIANQVNINLTSYFITLGDFTISGGGGTDIDIDDASIYVFGVFNGGATKLTHCDDYDNNTSNANDSCDIGSETAFEDNVDDGLIPPDILDLINGCTTIDVFISEPAEICNAASGVVNYLGDEVTTEIAFVVNMTAGNGSFNSTWEFSFILKPAAGAILSNVSDGSELLVDNYGAYTVTGIVSQSGAGSVVISMDVTGYKHVEQSVTMEITSALELKCNKPANDNSQWISEQIINAIPETSEIITN